MSVDDSDPMASEPNVGNGLFSSKGEISTPITSPKKSSSRIHSVIKPKLPVLRDGERLRSIVLASSPPGKTGVPRIILTEPTLPLESSDDEQPDIQNSSGATTFARVVENIEIELTSKVPRVIPEGISSWAKLDGDDICHVLELSKHDYKVMGCLFASLLKADPQLSALNLSHPTARRTFVDSLNGILRNNLLGEIAHEHKYVKKIQKAIDAGKGTEIIGYTLYRFAIEVKKDYAAGAYEYLEGLYAIAEGQDRPARIRKFLSPGFKKPYDAREHYRQLAGIQVPTTPFVKCIILVQNIFRGVFFGIFAVVLFHITVVVIGFVNDFYTLQIQIPDCKRQALQNYIEGKISFEHQLEMLFLVYESVSGYGLPSKFAVGSVGFLIGLYWETIRRNIGIFLVFCRF
ncbi:hypothetical protein AA313_de0202734 [Arthrobotrys entomopaga]|nr:hypothetical protein AA313_de0202734 [Arthrobotrys entomopaga]